MLSAASSQWNNMAFADTDLGGLPAIKSGGIDLGQIIKIAALMEQKHDREAKLGTPNTPASVRGTPASGYQPVPQIPGGGIPDSMSQFGVKFEPGVDSLLGTPAPLYVKGGASGTIGTTENARRMSLMPYSNPDSVDSNLQLLTGETNPATFNENFDTAAKGTKGTIDITEEASALFKEMGVNVEPGPMPAATYQQLKDLLTVKNLGKTEVGGDLQLKKMRADLAKTQAELAIKNAQAETLRTQLEIFNRLKKGGVQSSTGTAKSGDQLLTSPDQKIHINRKGKGPGWILPADFNPTTDTKIP